MILFILCLKMYLVHSLDELQDYLCVPQQKYNGDSRAVLFVKMRPGLKLTPEIRTKIERKVDEELWEDCVPELILEVPEIPVSIIVKNPRISKLGKYSGIFGREKQFLEVIELLCVEYIR